MASRAEANAVHVAGVAQGVVLVTLPAASTVFTDPSEYSRSNTRYGALLPHVVTAVAASLVGAGLGSRGLV